MRVGGLLPSWINVVVMGEVVMEMWETEFFDLWHGISQSNDQHVKVFKLVRNFRGNQVLCIIINYLNFTSSSVR